jgi:WD40 repeat protein
MDQTPDMKSIDLDELSASPTPPAWFRWYRMSQPLFPINSAAISDDGGRAVAATFEGNYNVYPPPPPVDHTYSVYCWDRQGQQLWLDQWSGYEGAFAVAISGDGLVAAAGGWMQPGKGFVRAYDATTGTQLLNNVSLPNRVNSLALSQDGSVLAVAANDAYLFQQSGGLFPSAPSTVSTGSGNVVESIDMPSDGSAFVMGDHNGNVWYVLNDNGNIGDKHEWAGMADIGPVHSVAISGDGNWFVAVGDCQTVYLYLESIQKSTYAGSLNLGTSAYDRMRWVTISDDGTFISVVGNLPTGGGWVRGIKNDNGTLSQLWSTPLRLSPNCASTDANGKFVAVAAGYTEAGEKPAGGLRVLEGATGKTVWAAHVKAMAWPCFISADASGIIAGSDYGATYYLLPVPAQS